MEPSTNDAARAKASIEGPDTAEGPGSDSPKDLGKQLKSQVAELKNAAIAAENSEIQARVRHLIQLIKTSLQSRTLDHKTQKELARLLSLTPTLDYRHSQQLNLLDLAVSMLLDPDSVTRLEDSSPANQSAAKNLVFVQETRRQIAHQSRPYPDLLKTIFITGGGTPYIRLISGLSWFFFLFVMLPLTVAGITFAARDIIGFNTANRNNTILSARNQTLAKQIDDQKETINSLTRRRETLAAQLGRTGGQIAELVPSEDSEPTATDADNTPNVVPVISPTELRMIGTEIDQALSADAKTANTASESGNVSNAVVIDLGADISRSEITNDSQTVEALPEEEGTAEETDEQAAEWLAAADRIFNASFSLILLAVAMGALGSTVSVIVRANTFIRQAEEAKNDLFLTGFFRPFVGMSFAIFCVALVEAGIFSGIFDLTERKEDRAYFYVAIAFVAGFSERLVRDVVIKTEDTLAGPPSE